MDKIDYITRQFSRAEKKRFEHYVVTRVWHLLNDLTIKFVTQQYVIRPSGRALTDMYFPQLGIHIEVDETHHLNQQEQDQLRQADIVNATNHRIERVKTSNGIENLNIRIDEVILIIRTTKTNLKEFKPWDMEVEQNPQTYIDKGFISTADDVAFKNSFLAANCFGYNYKGFQRGGVKHPKENIKIIWFPKLYKNEDWNNSISDDGKTIIEISEDSVLIKSHIDRIVNGKIHNRIVFARVKSPLGDIMYRFKGEYKLDIAATNYKKGLVWRKISDQVKTYKLSDI
ncbi:MAG TPA: hypothetical protein VIK14_00730 [Ignavibacteria bacterium]